MFQLGSTPVDVNKFLDYLDLYPHQEDALFLKEGFTNGFRLQFEGKTLTSSVKNLKSANLHLDTLKEIIAKEVQFGRMVGPFSKPPFLNLQVSPVGLVPKPDGRWRLITHLSFPAGSSVNDGIDENICSVSYSSFDKVSKMIFSLGKNALMAKRDIKSAFRLLPIHPDDFHLLGIKVDDQYYIDVMLPMGLSLSCSLFEKFSTFLQWLVSYKTNLYSLDHYLDDFILVGEEDSGTCITLVTAFSSICKEIGVPIADDKSIGPTTVLVFLGLELDSRTMTIRIPLHKINELRQILLTLLDKRKITLKELQSLVGKLNFFGQAVRSSRAFLRRFYDAMIPLKKPFHLLRLSLELKQDMQLWLKFLSEFNGVTYIPENKWFDSDCLQLFTDASGSANLGCGCYLAGKWSYFQWPRAWLGTEIMKDVTFLEMVPVLLAVHLWGNKMKKKNILFHIDNEALVNVINRQSCRSKRLMILVRDFVLLAMKLDCWFKSAHILTKCNGIADAISRMQWTRLRMLAPEAEEKPEPVPVQFQYLISKLKLIDL